jgi:transcriptional regulator with XRE-family HTH domain
MNLATAQCCATFGPRLKALREQRALTQFELAKLAGCDEATVRNWERRRGKPKFESLLILADTLDVSLNELMRGTP